MLSRPARRRSPFRFAPGLGLLAAILAAFFACQQNGSPPPGAQIGRVAVEDETTRAVVALVNDAAKLVDVRGEAAFDDLRAPGSRFRRGDAYVFVLDPNGRMLVHPDPAIEGKDELDLRDVDGKPIVRGLIAAATTTPNDREGWYHYQWTLPGGLLPRWKSSFVRLVKAPSGKSYVVGSGVYTDRMERAFVVDMVDRAVASIEKSGAAAFGLFRDRSGPFRAKDAYVFVLNPQGVELVNPAFRNLEGKNLLDWRDTSGKALVEEMLDVAQTRGAGWVDYLWPKPGESASTQKSAYVRRARLGDSWVAVGCGVYLADAPKSAAVVPEMNATQLMALVAEGAEALEKRGEAVYPEFRTRGTTWFRDDTYFFVWKMDGTRAFHAADPKMEGTNGAADKDAMGRPYGRMFLDVATSAKGEGWVHYVYPQPGNIFPTWKSTFLKRVTLPSGEHRLLGSGIYDMQMDRSFVEDVVDRASALVADQGKAAFPRLRDETGPFRFLDTYVFVDAPDGTELVNPAHPSLEGRNVLDLADPEGKPIARDWIEAAGRDGSAWVETTWFKPGHDTLARKLVFVRRVQSGTEAYFVGSGLYAD